MKFFYFTEPCFSYYIKLGKGWKIKAKMLIKSDLAEFEMSLKNSWLVAFSEPLGLVNTWL